ncbi:MAG: DnaA/Hda family protein, partial [Donghicola eburneus]
MTQEQWSQIRQDLRQVLGQNNFTAWIEPLQFQSLHDGIATFNVPTNFMGNYLTQNYADTILSSMNSAGVAVRRIQFVVASRQQAKAQAAVGTAPAAAANKVETPVSADRPGDMDLPGAPLDARFSFDRFVVGKPNELAHAAARRVAEGGPVSFNPLFLYGGVGLGKTHLMHAIAWELHLKSPHLNVVYLSAEQFMYRFVQALRDRKMM